MVKCKPNYKNLNEIQSFSEQRYVTVQLMEQACMNDEYLKQYCERLNYLSPPAVRISLKDMINWIDDDKSYGYAVNQGVVRFSSRLEESILIDFNDSNLIDFNKTTANIVTYVDGVPTLGENDTYEETEGTDQGTVITRCELPVNAELIHNEAVYDYSTANMDTAHPPNTYAYIAFNKAKNYYVQPAWLKNWRDYEMKAIARAQTFKAKTDGTLVAVDLELDFNGYNWYGNTGSPLYVQIWETHKKQVKKTKYDPTTQSIIYDRDGQGNIRTETIAWPANRSDVNDTEYRYRPLAEAIWDDDKTSDWRSGAVRHPTIVFPKPLKVKKGYSYAIVLMSPLSEYKHCPCWGGWTRASTKDKYPDGDAFYSENHGGSFVRYGENTFQNNYKQAMKDPVDFAFRCHIRTVDESDTTKEEYALGNYYLYLKPIVTNPITQFKLTRRDYGETETNNKIHIRYHYSVNGRNWKTITDLTTYTVLDEPSPILFIRARLFREQNMVGGVDINANETPFIENINIDLKTQLPSEMYFRTNFINAKSTQMLQGNIWSRIYSNMIMDPNTNCTVDVIEDITPINHFRLVALDELSDILLEYGLDVAFSEYTLLDTDVKKAEYVVNNPSILSSLKSEGIYLVPVVLDVNGTDVLYKFSFTPEGGEMVIQNPTNAKYTFGGIEFKNNVAYPILYCKYNEGLLDEQAYAEGIDYTFDYENNILSFDKVWTNKNTVSDIHSGVLSVSYNRIFLKGLTDSEIGTHLDENTTLQEEGLIMDYLKETIDITPEHIETRRVPLRCRPVDPIRSVILNPDTDNEVLHEKFDYTVDVETNELIFEVANSNGASVLSLNDKLEVVYTPNLDCESICLGFHATRTDNSKQVSISDSYIEYKT